MSLPVRVELFGGIRLQIGEKSVTKFETQKTSFLLGILAYELDRSHLREQLVDRFWPDSDYDKGSHSLSAALSALRRDLGDVLITDGPQIGLRAASFTTDVAQFEDCLRRARETEGPQVRLDNLVEAIGIYRGELLPGFDDEWIASERERLAEAFVSAHIEAAPLLFKNGDRSEAIDLVQRAIAFDPLREDACCLLMRMYEKSGRRSEVLRLYHDLERRLNDYGTKPSSATRALYLQIQSDGRSEQDTMSSGPSVRSGSHQDAEPGGALPLDSPYYIARATDDDFVDAVVRRESIVLVKGPAQTGKSSLLARGLQTARDAGARVVFTDLQSVDNLYLETPRKFLFHLAQTIQEELNLPVSPNEDWDDGRPQTKNFERFIKKHVLGASEAPFVWGLDEVDRLFLCSFREDIFGLFRSWHNNRSFDPTGTWRRMTLVMAYATEARLFITDLNQSPFNVGTRLALRDFSEGDVAQLNIRFDSPLQHDNEIPRLYTFLGGHPYLVSKGFHEIRLNGMDLGEFEMQAVSGSGCFGDHLRRMLAKLTQDPELCEEVRAVLRGSPCSDATRFFRLESAGVLAGDSHQVARLRCPLYKRYLEQHLL